MLFFISEMWSCLTQVILCTVSNKQVPTLCYRIHLPINMNSYRQHLMNETQTDSNISQPIVMKPQRKSERVGL